MLNPEENQNIKIYQSQTDSSGFALRRYDNLFGYVYAAYFNNYESQIFYETIEKYVVAENILKSDLQSNI